MLRPLSKQGAHSGQSGGRVVLGFFEQEVLVKSVQVCKAKNCIRCKRQAKGSGHEVMVLEPGGVAGTGRGEL